MNVLIAGEFSGVVRDAFSARNHNAWSCDLLPSETGGHHHQGDVMNILDRGWDLMIAHPECTYLCNSGVCHLHTDPTRWERLDRAAEFFRRLWECNIPKVAIENPIPHKYAVERIGEKYTQIIHPWQHGHPEKKATCLWLRGLPKIFPTYDVRELMMSLPKNKQQRGHYLSPGPNRWKERSRTFSGIGQAFAEQWG